MSATLRSSSASGAPHGLNRHAVNYRNNVARQTRRLGARRQVPLRLGTLEALPQGGLTGGAPRIQFSAHGLGAVPATEGPLNQQAATRAARSREEVGSAPQKLFDYATAGRLIQCFAGMAAGAFGIDDRAPCGRALPYLQRRHKGWAG